MVIYILAGIEGDELNMVVETATMNIWCTCTKNESVVFKFWICIGGLHTGGTGLHSVQRDYFKNEDDKSQ